MREVSQVAKSLTEHFTYEELEIFDRTARELGLEDAESVFREVLSKADAIHRFKQRGRVGEGEANRRSLDERRRDRDRQGPERVR